METWPTTLAREFAPREERVAEEIVRRYAQGGRTRRSLLIGTGERTGSFGGPTSPGELALVLDALKQCGPLLLGVLEHPAVGNTAGVAALLVAVAQWRQARKPDRDSTSNQSEIRVTIDVSPAVEVLVNRALEESTSQFSARGYDKETARDRAGRLLHTLARDPSSAAEFIRTLDKSLRSVQRGIRVSVLGRSRKRT
jgi:hypothetical protein